MIKVVYVITKANWGGAQRYVFDLATRLPKEQFEASVAFGQPGRLADALKTAAIPTHTVRSMQRDVSFGADIKSFFELYRLFYKEQPRVVHLNSSKAGGVGALAARFAGVPTVVFTAHGWPFWEERSWSARKLIWLASWLTALLVDTVICISDFDLAVARKMPGITKKAVRIYNGIDINAPLGTGDVIRAAFPVGVSITGTIGELNKNKNQIALIEEAAQKPDMYVAIVGEGELRETLEQKIQEYQLQDRVKLFGFMPASEVLKGFDTFALPSIKEGLPYVLLEARAAGLPIVANPVGGIPEILAAKDITEFSVDHMLANTLALYR
ncbi:MAG TPA: glycosyltransferase [Candidatus Paceibacterota bacterium]